MGCSVNQETRNIKTKHNLEQVERKQKEAYTIAKKSIKNFIFIFSFIDIFRPLLFERLNRLLNRFGCPINDNLFNKILMLRH